MEDIASKLAELGTIFMFTVGYVQDSQMKCSILTQIIPTFRNGKKTNQRDSIAMSSANIIVDKTI
jgi:predicted transcriptional regulator